MTSLCCTNESIGVFYLNALISGSSSEVRFKVLYPYILVTAAGRTLWELAG